ncbi:hypothetical protein VTJ83DRAFT_1396 [Remersonia thermophila]|uniref:Uncharacterized protein n=1 Tax=Remersonia thermophila TaxID=72144 RepID=A0ABR4DPM8_9PEZI
MTAMGVQLQPFGSGLEPYGSWNFGSRQLRKARAELEAALLEPATISNLSDRLLEISKAGITGCRSLRTPRIVTLGPLERRPDVPKPTEVCWRLLPVTFHPSLVFARPRSAEKTRFTFSAPPTPAPPSQPCLKRRRPDTDVDGPNTSELACKKRRLRRELVTSRLSQPFSLPATHVLNREAAATGDTRFARLAAIMSARRMQGAAGLAVKVPRQPHPSTFLRRAAALNSLRARVCAAAGERAAMPISDLSAKAAALGQSHGSTAARFLVDLIQPLRTAAASTVSRPSPPAPTPSPRSTGHDDAAACSPAPTATCLRITSPKMRPLRSPELRAARPFIELEDIDDLLVDDDSMAFPTSELESRYEDDLDDDDGSGVYTDFSVIFGGGGPPGEGDDDSRSSGSSGDMFEDYLDDLDGFS